MVNDFSQKQVTVRSSVLEVLLEITKFCDLYLMERVLDDETEVKHRLFIFLVCCSFTFYMVDFVLSFLVHVSEKL